MKKAKKIIFQLLIIIIIATITFFVGRQIGLNTETSTTVTTVEEVTVSTQTITNTLTGSGEISSATTETLSLSTSKYFETMCVEEDDIVEEGENILKYTNGTYLTAPYDCVISSYSVPETEEQATDENYVMIQDMENLVMTLSVDESEISLIDVGQEVEIVLTADEDTTYYGEITKISSTGTYSSSGTSFTVTIGFENDGSIKLGMSASCTIIIEELTDVIAVPIEAVETDGDTKYVVVVDDDGETTQVEIETGSSDDEYVEVTSGLEGGETIQITTTTTQSTSSSSSDDSSEAGMESMMGGGDMEGFSGGSMEMPSGDASGGNGGMQGGPTQ